MEKDKDQKIITSSVNGQKKWTPPILTIYGDMRVVTQGSNVYGSGDVGYEHQKPLSPGASG